MSVGVWLVVAGTGWGFCGMAPEDFRSPDSPLKEQQEHELK